MAFVATDSDGNEHIYPIKPQRDDDYYWYSPRCISLHKGTIKKLIGRYLTWDDEPVELKEELFDVSTKMCKTCRYEDVAKSHKPCCLCFKKSHYEKEG